MSEDRIIRRFKVNEGEETCMDRHGNHFEMLGIQIRSKDRGDQFYGYDDPFFKACVFRGWVVKGYIENGRVVLI